MRRIYLPSIILIFTFYFISCGDKKETLSLETPSEYFLAQPGKYIIYRLDSLVFTQAGRAEEIHTYQEKHVVDAEITDATGRRSLRIYRFLRDSAGTEPWRSAGSYQLTPLQNSVEILEDNLRLIPLVAPVKQGTRWKGNLYLNEDPYASFYNFNNDDDMNAWDFEVVAAEETIQVNGITLPHVTTILRIDESDVPDTITVSSNSLTITSPAKTIWLRGTATDTIRLQASAPRQGNTTTIYNRTNKPVSLNNIPVPVNFGRTYEYSNGNWKYGDNIDTVFADLPLAYRNYGLDKYAKNIGLVYQELFMWEFQPNTGGTPFKVGFGIKRSLLEHN